MCSEYEACQWLTFLFYYFYVNLQVDLLAYSVIIFKYELIAYFVTQLSCMNYAKY
jgi:hypothetical protein